MAENRGLKRTEKIKTGQIEPEERRPARPKLRVVKERDFEAQKNNNIRLVDRLMSEYEVMPDSFIMPEMYAEGLSVELERGRRNKLITGWFTKMFQALAVICEQYDFNKNEIDKLNNELKRLIGEEDEAAMKLIHKSLGDRRLEQILAEELPRIVKEGKKGVARDFLARKVSVIERLEELASDIRKKLLEEKG